MLINGLSGLPPLEDPLSEKGKNRLVEHLTHRHADVDWTLKMLSTMSIDTKMEVGVFAPDYVPPPKRTKAKEEPEIANINVEHLLQNSDGFFSSLPPPRLKTL